MRLALFEPDIPQNAGAMLRLAACLNMAVDIIEPCGFVLGDRRMRRAGLDYVEKATMLRHDSWRAYCAWRAENGEGGRLLLLTTKGDMAYTDFVFRSDDTLLMGRESAGVPAAVSSACDARLRIPMAAGMRSINVAQAAAMALGEALRQTGMFPAP